jgi:serine/threonine protein kinase
MHGFQHESPKRLRSNDQKAELCDERNLRIDRHGESDDTSDPNEIEKHSHASFKGKAHRNLEFRCHVHNSSGSNITLSPGVEEGRNVSHWTGSSARTSKAEDSMFDSFGHGIHAIGGSGLSPMLPGPVRRAMTLKPSRSGNYDSCESFVSSISATSSPSSFSRDGGGSSMYAHELSREEEEEDAQSFQKASDEHPASRHESDREQVNGPDSFGTRTKTAIQLFQDSRPNSPDSLDDSNKLVFDEGEEEDNHPCGSGHDLQVGTVHIGDGPSDRNTRYPRHNWRGRSHGQEGDVDPHLVRLENSFSVDYISDTEDDSVSQPSSCERPGRSGRSSHSSSAWSLPIPPAERCESPDDFLTSGVPGRLLSYSSHRLSRESTPGRGSGAAGGLFGNGSTEGSGGEISPVSMNRSFDSRDGDGGDQYCSSASSSPRHPGHSIFSDLIRAASDSQLLSDEERSGANDMEPHAHRSPAPERCVRGWASCGSSPVKALPETPSGSSFPELRQAVGSRQSGLFWDARSRQGIASHPNKTFAARSPALGRSLPSMSSNSSMGTPARHIGSMSKRTNDNSPNQKSSSSSFARSCSPVSRSAEGHARQEVPHTVKRRSSSARSPHRPSPVNAESGPPASLLNRSRSSSFDHGVPSASPSRETEEEGQHPARGLSLNMGQGSEEMAWTGVGKRSRSPRCVSPRYGSHVSPDTEAGNDDEESPLDAHNSSIASSVDSSGSRRPLPDQSAFDSNHLNTSHHSTGSHQSPVCPPTPDRSPQYLYDGAEVEQETGGRGGGIFDSDKNVAPAPAMRRVNSLIDTKVLASSMDAPHEWEDSSPTARRGHEEDVVFYRDFINEGLMGSGTFAEVFRVSLRNDRSQTFAIKKSRRKFRSRKDRETLLNEVRIMQIVGAQPCKHIIQFYRAWQEDSFFYVQIELAERGTLKDMMTVFANQRKRIDDRTMLRILHGVAAGLEHIHNCHVVHLDIKPPNVLIGLDGTLKIGDFGIAMQAGGGADEAHEGDTRYLPEELLNSSERHPSADMFSLGLTLYELCQVPEMDVLPYGGSLWHDLREGKGVDFSSPAEGGRQEDLCAIIHACMSPDPTHRPSASDILNHPAVTNLDLSTPCPALCGASVQAPSPIIFRSGSFCPIGSSDTNGGASLLINTAHTPSMEEEEDRNMSTPLMGASYNTLLFRILSPPTELMGDAHSDHYSHHQQHSSGWGGSGEKGHHHGHDSSDMETTSDHREEAVSALASANCFTPSSHSNSPTRSFFWARGGNTPTAEYASASSNTPSQQGPLLSGGTPSTAAYRNPSPRTGVKKKGGRPRGPIRKVN